TDAALALIESQLPQWSIRRIQFEESGWLYCSLCLRWREMGWLQEFVVEKHRVVRLARLSAFVQAMIVDQAQEPLVAQTARRTHERPFMPPVSEDHLPEAPLG